jgi:hypothetical protein
MDQLITLEPLSSAVALRKLGLRPCTSLQSLAPLGALSQLKELNLESLHHLSSLETQLPFRCLWKLSLEMCTSLTSLEPLSTLTELLDLDLSFCTSLPPSALFPLSRCTTLKQLDIRWCPAFDLAPLTSCRDLHRLYICSYDKSELDLTPLLGLMPRLVVKEADGYGFREEYDDARDL